MALRHEAERQYATTDPLKVRMETHARYSERQIDLDEECRRTLALTGDEVILDVGCGPGLFLSYLRRHGHRGRLVGLDRSEAMITEASRRDDTVEWVVGDALALPFRNGEFDWVVARHMLYYIDDVPSCLGDFTRVIQPAGRFLAMTNSLHSAPRILDLWDDTLRAFGLPGRQFAPDKFHIENAVETLRTVWTVLDEIILDNAFVFTSSEPIVRYTATLLASTDQAGDPQVWSVMIDWLDREAARRLRELGGVWRDPKSVGLYVCRVPNVQT